MRVIKFRGLDIMGNWYYGLLANPKVDIGGAKKDHWYICNNAGVPFAYEIRPETIGEFTGLQDKNSLNIYEGDIVKHNGIHQQNKLMEIRFIDGAFCLYFNGNPDRLNNDNAATIRDVMFEAQSFDQKLKLEVMGNIYKNPELLEGAK